MAPKARMRFGTDAPLEEAKVEVQIADEQPQEVTDVGITELVKAMAHIQDAPDYDTVLDWKETYGAIYTQTTNGDDFYLFRPLKRLEYKKMVASGAAAKEDRYEEALVKKCLLWPIPDSKFIAEANAFLISTLRKQIEFKSGFVPDNIAIELIRVI